MKVNYQTAKLLKEKGYSVGTKSVFFEYHKTYEHDNDPNHPESYKKGEIRFEEGFYHRNVVNKSSETPQLTSLIDLSNKHFTIYEAPNIYDVVEWFRTKHGIWVYVVCDVIGEDFYCKISICSEKNWRDLDFRDKFSEAEKAMKPYAHRLPEQAYNTAFIVLFNFDTKHNLLHS